MNRVEIEIPDDVSAETDHLELTVEGPNGSVTRRLWYPDVEVTVEDGVVAIASENEDAKTNATVGTFESHVANMIHGVTDGWEYTMEVYYAHFPMQVTVEGGEVVIENFLGERAQRRTPIRGDTDVQIDGETVTLSAPTKEAVGRDRRRHRTADEGDRQGRRVSSKTACTSSKPTGGA